MDWHLAIEKNRQALKRVLAMLVAMAGFGDLSVPGDAGTLPRHLHRFVLRLLRPAEAATRRLIIVAAHGLIVEPPARRPRKPKPEPKVFRNWMGIAVTIAPGQTLQQVCPSVSAGPVRLRKVSLSLFDPLKRFGVRRRYVKPSAMPRIIVFDDMGVPLFQPQRQPDPLPPTPDDPLDAGRLCRRLAGLASVLDDLPRAARRVARWRALRKVALERERDTHRQARFLRVSQMRPGRPPGWRRKPTHPVDEILNELHGLAVWAGERQDSS